MKLLLYSFLFGIIHLFAGLAVRFYMLWKDGKKLDAFCDVIPVYLLVAGIAPLGAGIIIDVPQTLTNVGKYVALVGAVLTVLTSGRSSKNIIGKLGGGLYGLYNTASGYLGDILSYSRLMTLMLAGSVIASVFNTLGAIPGNVVFFLLVSVAGNGLNFALNLLSCYVHDLRLQCLEYFGKFYQDGGKPFEPLAINTKYVDIQS